MSEARSSDLRSAPQPGWQQVARQEAAKLVGFTDRTVTFRNFTKREVLILVAEEDFIYEREQTFDCFRKF